MVDFVHAPLLPFPFIIFGEEWELTSVELTRVLFSAARPP